MVLKSKVCQYFQKTMSTSARFTICKKDISMLGGQTSGVKRHLVGQHLANLKVTNNQKPSVETFVRSSLLVSMWCTAEITDRLSLHHLQYASSFNSWVWIIQGVTAVHGAELQCNSSRNSTSEGGQFSCSFHQNSNVENLISCTNFLWNPVCSSANCF